MLMSIGSGSSNASQRAHRGGLDGRSSGDGPGAGAGEFDAVLGAGVSRRTAGTRQPGTAGDGGGRGAVGGQNARGDHDDLGAGGGVDGGGNGGDARGAVGVRGGDDGDDGGNGRGDAAGDGVTVAGGADGDEGEDGRKVGAEDGARLIKDLTNGLASRHKAAEFVADGSIAIG